MRSNLTRRRFLTLGGGSALWLASGCRNDGSADSQPVVSSDLDVAIMQPALGSSSAGYSGPNDRVLVLVQFLGGNDALNTLVPVDGRYRDARPTVFVDEDQVLRLDGLDKYGLHPSLDPLVKYWEEGRLAIAAGTGFAQQTRSHFESRDVWWRAADDVDSDGWLARWMEAAAIDQPDEPLEAIALGVGPRALAGSAASSVSDPVNFSLSPPQDMTEADYEKFLLAVSLESVRNGPSEESAALTAVRGSLPVALSTKKILDALSEEGAGDPYSELSRVGLDVQLATAASLISSRPGLRVVTVGIDGFDTHSNQLESQSNLLGGAASAIADFWEALPEADQERTLMMTTSEFGRRVSENGSAGTDHGRGGVQFLLGGPARDSLAEPGVPDDPRLAGGQLIGDLDLQDLDDGDLSLQVETTDLFAEALRWLGGPISEVLGSDPPATSLLK